MLRAFSSRQRGVFVSVDGPRGAGKSIIVRHLAQLLLADGGLVHVTAEPSEGLIGLLYRELTESVTGHALACLYAADRSQRPAEQPAAFIRDRLMAFFGATHLTGAS